MGCLNTKQGMLYEEAKILGLESLLEYYKNSSVLIDSVHRKYSADGFINSQQWADISETLQIRIKNCPSCLKIEDFFSLFLDDLKIPVKKMSILGILLGCGHPRQKARLLFEIFDVGCNGVLTLSEVESMFDEIFDISCTKLVKLADFEETDYEKRLETGYLAKKNEIFQMVVNGDSQKVDLKNFVMKLETDLGKLLHPHGFRMFCLSK